MSQFQEAKSIGLLAWFASNPVAANVLMMLILVGGLFGYQSMDKEVFPRFNPHQIEVIALYLATASANNLGFHNLKNFFDLLIISHI